MGEIVRIDKRLDLDAGLSKAGDVLLAGGIIAFPTESFYGLGVDAMNEEAVKRLFDLKERDLNHPVLILIHERENLSRYVDEIPEIADNLMDRFWPGGLTLIFRAHNNISEQLIAGTGKIGIRLSSHPIATAIAGSINSPITGTSANISGQPACIDAKSVYNSLGDRIDLILDGGKTSGERGSTILDITCDPPVILREGIVSLEELKEFILN